jgi:hypothetical protein
VCVRVSVCVRGGGGLCSQQLHVPQAAAVMQAACITAADSLCAPSWIPNRHSTHTHTLLTRRPQDMPSKVPLCSCRNGAPVVLITQHRTAVPAKLEILPRDQGGEQTYAVKVRTSRPPLVCGRMRPARPVAPRLRPHHTAALSVTHTHTHILLLCWRRSCPRCSAPRSWTAGCLWPSTRTATSPA